MKLTAAQKKTLNLLLDKYERSSLYGSEAGHTRAIMIRPTEIFRDYESDFADVDDQRNFENDMVSLKMQGLINIRQNKKENVISKIELDMTNVSLIYQALLREPLADSVKKQLDFYKAELGKNSLADSFCRDQIKRLEEGKKAQYDIDTAQKLLELLAFALSNEDMILEREMSIMIFGDTKTFENGYRSKLISLLKTYGDFEDVIGDVEDEREISHALLEELNIYANPQYVYFKGNGQIDFRDGKSYLLSSDLPLAMPMDRLKYIESFLIDDETVMTVENLAAYNRISPSNCFCLYLAGYHNSSKSFLLKLLYNQNKNKTWQHFGDLDPDGFLILEHLKRKTGINFAPVNMDLEQLKTFAQYTKPLQPNDITKAKGLLEKGQYVEIMDYMLANNVKLEQEIISCSKPFI